MGLVWGLFDFTRQRERLLKKRFPGFQECMRLMRKRDAQLQEDGFHFLLPHAHEYVQQLIDEFSHETDSGLRWWLLELIADEDGSGEEGFAQVNSAEVGSPQIDSEEVGFAEVYMFIWMFFSPLIPSFDPSFESL